MSDLAFTPDYAVHPSETVLELIEERNWSHESFEAAFISAYTDPYDDEDEWDREYNVASLLVKFIFHVDPRAYWGETTCRVLGEVFGLPTSFWLARDRQWREFSQQRTEEE